MAAVRVENQALHDPRYEMLGKRIGTTKHDALGRMVRVWEYCTEKKAYFVSSEVLDIVAEHVGFALALCHSDVDLGEQTDHGVRVKGTKGRIEWLAIKRKNGKKGGRPRKPKAKPNDNLNETETKPIGLNLENPLALVLTPSPALVKKKIIYTPEFETFWEKYPKKVHKDQAFNAFQKQVNPNALEMEQLAFSLNNYLTYCKLNTRFHLDASTFLAKWHSWLEPEVPLDMSEDDAARFSFLKDKKLRDVNDTP